MKIKLTWRLWILVIILALSVISIINFSGFQKGVVITSVNANSTAFEAGLRQGQVIIDINGLNIETLEDFSNSLAEKFTSNESVKTVITTKEIQAILFSNQPPEITVSNVPPTNLKLGLDLAGGARALVKASDKDLSSSEARDLANVLSNRINVYGISDLSVSPVSDLSGNNFILIELAGATPKDIEQLVSQQGKFEAKIGNETVFIGGEKDIASVCRNDATCAFIESCLSDQSGGYFCNFRFSVFLSEDAARKHAKITENLSTNITPQGSYLSENLDLFLDDQLVDSLLISESLKGQIATEITISGSGSGATQDEAIKNAENEMHRLQTTLITGSLPYKLEIVKLDTISPALGKEFIRSILLAGVAALVAVALVVSFRYKKFKTSFALLFTSFSEIVIILGIAAFIEWNLDLPSIAGILATIGTGIDQQIIIIDEARQKGETFSIKQKMKRALAIIVGAYFTAFVSLLPLLWAGAGLLKGFAITTIIGITAGILITRPAFTDLIKKIEE